LITTLQNANDQMENSHLNWENGAVSGKKKNYSLPSSSETASAVEPFQQ
jgi:hypothetical protein